MSRDDMVGFPSLSARLNPPYGNSAQPTALAPLQMLKPNPRFDAPGHFDQSSPDMVSFPRFQLGSTHPTETRLNLLPIAHRPLLSAPLQLLKHRIPRFDALGHFDQFLIVVAGDFAQAAEGFFFLDAQPLHDDPLGPLDQFAILERLA